MTSSETVPLDAALSATMRFFCHILVNEIPDESLVDLVERISEVRSFAADQASLSVQVKRMSAPPVKVKVLESRTRKAFLPAELSE